MKRLPAWRFLGYAQNHDQVGNRAKGERLSHLVNLGRAKIAAAFVFTAPFVPMLFQGEEWAATSPFQYFTDHEAELGKLVSEGRKKEFAAFGWNPDEIPDPQDEQTFLRSKLNWDEQFQQPHAEMLAWYRNLIALRKAHPDLTNGSLEEIQVEYSEDEKWLVLRRGSLEVAANLGDYPLQRYLSAGASMLLASDSAIKLEQASLIVPQDTVAILKIE